MNSRALRSLRSVSVFVALLGILVVLRLSCALFEPADGEESDGKWCDEEQYLVPPALMGNELGHVATILRRADRLDKYVHMRIVHPLCWKER